MENEKNNGSQVTFTQLAELMDLVFKGGEGEDYLPFCIWGSHGIGKTDFVEGYARKNGWKFQYFNPGQLEELSDAHGMPVVEKDTNGAFRTVFASPKWVPTSEGPGILLLDDLNRADDRILRGFMQLLQKKEMFSWKLPPNWRIVATANPEQDYSVTTMDEAMLTRMMHFSVEFDLENWCSWATDNEIDNRCIKFVRAYPELVCVGKTTPRTLVHFFKLVAKVGDWFKEMQMVRALAESLLDPFAASSFCSFVERELDFFMGAEEFLNLEEYAVFQVVFGLDGKTDGKAGLDRLSLHANRVIKLMSAKKYRLRKSHKVNILRFLGDETIPADLRNKFRLDLARLKNPMIRRFVKSPKFTEQFLSSI